MRPIEPKSRAGLRTVPIIGVLDVFLADLAASPFRDALLFGRLPDAPFDPKTINDWAKWSWTVANEAEEEAAERVGVIRTSCGGSPCTRAAIPSPRC